MAGDPSAPRGAPRKRTRAAQAPPERPSAVDAVRVPVDSLVLLPGNPNVGDVDAVARSLLRFGQRKAITVRASDNVVTAGNTTLLAHRQLGWTEIDALVLDDDEATSKAWALADNQTARLGHYDHEALAAMVGEVAELDPELLDATGFTEAELARMLRGNDTGRPPLNDPDDAPPVPKRLTSKMGDVWRLGPHRLIVGDAREQRVVEEVMAGELADLVWTDPPYGVDYVGKTKNALTIENDELGFEALLTLLRRSLGAAWQLTRPGGAWYVAAPAGPNNVAFGMVLLELDVFRQQIVWVKDRFVLGRSDLHWRHEAIFYGAKAGAERYASDELVEPEPEATAELEGDGDFPPAHEGIVYGWKPGAGHLWTGGRKQDTVWEIPRPKASREHPTMKPVELVARGIRNNTRPGDVVLDVFAGSGTTLIASEREGRVARLVECDPRYADVICRRWQEHTGDLPVRDRTGDPIDFVEAG